MNVSNGVESGAAAFEFKDGQKAVPTCQQPASIGLYEIPQVAMKIAENSNSPIVVGRRLP
jgi:hypothetical protein